MEIRSSEEIDEEIAGLRRELELRIAQEAKDAEAILARQRADEKLRQEQEAEALKHRLEAHERQLIEDDRQSQLWWQERRRTCYVPATDALFRAWELCQAFIDSLESEAQRCDWCSQCQYGYKNPGWLAGRRWVLMKATG